MPSSPRASAITIRPCEARDVAQIAAIYAHYVRTTLVSFELEPPSPDEMAARRRAIVDARFPYFVATDAETIVGYAYAAPYRARPAYRFSAENSVYVAQGRARRGIGRRLMEELFAACEARGLRQLVAVIGDSANTASIGLHRSLGFEMIGTLRSGGYKFGRWVDVVLMQRALGAGDGKPPPE